MRRALNLIAVVVMVVLNLGADDCFSTGGDGDDTAGDPCAVHVTCGSCIGDPACGYCDGACLAGTESGPDAYACSGTWSWTQCPASTCDEGACALQGGHCTPSGECVLDAPICGVVSCPSSYTWSWTTGGGGSAPTCCIDAEMFDGWGASCGRADGTCRPSGGENPAEVDVSYTPSTMRCQLPSGTIDCPALYIGPGAGGSQVYQPGCCAETSAGAICGVGANGCYAPTGAQTPVF